MIAWLHQLYTQDGMQHLIATGGIVALAAIIFAETGLFIGLFLPGDSLLLAAGVCCRIDPLAVMRGDALQAAPPLLSLVPTVLTLILAAMAGNLVNGWLGHATGERIRIRPEGRFFKRRYLDEAVTFYHRWGGWALVAGRFVPIVRTFVPFAAGLAGMGRAAFVLWSAIGAVGWIGSMIGLGYALASNATLVKQLHLLVLAVVALSFVPVGIGLIARWRRGAPVTPS